MKIIQGFVTKDSFIDNQAGVVNEFFELSPLSLTFSKTRGEYQDATFQGNVLQTFKVFDVDTNSNVKLNAAEVKLVMSVVNSVLTYCSSYMFQSVDFINHIRALYPLSISNFSHGNLYEGENLSMPDWTSWTTENGDLVRIWHRDEAFQNQYSFFEIVTVPPFDSVDHFFSKYSTVSAEIKALSMGTVMERIQEAKGVYPESYTRMLTFKFYNPNNPAQFVETQWAVLIYGKNGDNIDSIKDSIVDYLLTHSQHTEAEWRVIFPEIFQRSEFVFFPRWDKVAIANTTDLGAIYSSIYSPVEMRNFIKRNYPTPDSLTDVFLDQNLRTIPFDYKAINCGVVSGITNSTDQDGLEEIFPDYIPVNTSSPDFNRMSVKTRTWVLRMVELIRLAETATEYSTVMNPMRRVIRNNQLFVCFIYENINYLVSVKKNQLT